MEKIRASDLADSTHVLAVGVSTYTDPTVQDLAAAGQEARNFADALCDPAGCAIPPPQVRVLPSPVAASDIVSALKASSAACGEASVLIVYFSGHAFRDETGIYLCGSNANRQDLKSTSLSGSDLADALSSCPARGILLILDCCVSAGFAEHAPEFFHRTQGKDFRVLLAASREDQLSWEIGNGQGTLFSKYLIEIIRGTISAGTRAGEISLNDLVESIDFHLKEDLKVMHPDVPAQEPIVAGAFNRDPVLFFHRRNGLAGLTVEKDRVSRSLHRRRIRRLAIAGILTAAFGFLTYLTWLDKHFYASADENLVRIYRGYPRLGGPGFPQLVWEEPLATAAFQSGSPLKTGGTVVAPLDGPIEPTLDAQLDEVASISKMHLEGHDAEARVRLIALLGRPGLGPEESHFAHLLLGEIGTSEELPKLRRLLADSRPEIRTSSIKAILRLSPKEGFGDLKNALGDFDRFDQRSLINEFAGPCPDGAQDYFDAAASAAGFNSVYPELADAAARIGCPMSGDALSRMGHFWPDFELSDLAKYAILFREDQSSVAATLDPLHRAFFLSDFECPKEIVKQGFGLAPNSIAWINSVVLLLSSGCAKDPGIKLSFTAHRQLAIDTGQKGISFLIPPSVDPGLGMAMIPRLDTRGDTVSISFLRAMVDENPNKPMQATALTALIHHGVFIQPSSQLLNSEVLDLRRAAYTSLSSLDHAAAVASLRARISDQDLIDWPDLFYSVKPTAADLNALRPFLRGGALEKQRASAVSAMFGSEADIHELAADPLYEDRRSASLYIGGNEGLTRFGVAPASGPFDDYVNMVKTAQLKKSRMEEELARIPGESREWRIQQILEWRGNAFDTSFKQVLSPGLKLWLKSGAH